MADLYIHTWILLSFCTLLGQALEDCGINKQVDVAWAWAPPYFFKAKGNMRGAYLDAMTRSVQACCGSDYKLAIEENAVGTMRHLEEASVRRAGALFITPVARLPNMLPLDALTPGQVFVPLTTASGYFMMKYGEKAQNTVLTSLVGTWPLWLLVMSSASVAGIIMWILDHKRNTDQFPTSFTQGAWEGTWWAFVTMTTVGYGDKSPKAIPARCFGLIWMFIGIVIMSIFTATLVSAFGAEQTTDIKGIKVGVMNGSLEEHVAFHRGARVTSYVNDTAMMQALQQQDVDLLLMDTNRVLFGMKQLKEKLIVPSSIIWQESVHGIIIKGFKSSTTTCFIGQLSSLKFQIHDFTMSLSGWLEVEAGDRGNSRSSDLLYNTLIVTYVLIGVLVLLVLCCVLWEYVLKKRWQSKPPIVDNKEASSRL